MGMCLALHSVSDRNIENILESPHLIWRLIAPEDPEIYLESVNKNKKGFLSRVFGEKNSNSSQVIPDLEYVKGENVADDLDKSWHGIHYCLNKTDYDAEPPMDFLTVGGRMVGDIDVGYGPARLFESKTVKEIDKRVSNIATDQLHVNYNPSEMERFDIYPNIWGREGEEGFEYISEYFENLKSFVAGCSKNNLGMAVYLY